MLPAFALLLAAPPQDPPAAGLYERVLAEEHDPERQPRRLYLAIAEAHGRAAGVRADAEMEFVLLRPDGREEPQLRARLEVEYARPDRGRILYWNRGRPEVPPLELLGDGATWWLLDRRGRRAWQAPGAGYAAAQILGLPFLLGLGGVPFPHPDFSDWDEPRLDADGRVGLRLLYGEHEVRLRVRPGDGRIEEAVRILPLHGLEEDGAVVEGARLLRRLRFPVYELLDAEEARRLGGPLPEGFILAEGPAPLPALDGLEPEAGETGPGEGRDR